SSLLWSALLALWGLAVGWAPPLRRESAPSRPHAAQPGARRVRAAGNDRFCRTLAGGGRHARHAVAYPVSGTARRPAEQVTSSVRSRHDSSWLRAGVH